MRRDHAVFCPLILACLISPLFSTSTQAKPKNYQPKIKIYNPSSDLIRDFRGLFSATQVDTYVLAEFDFESMSGGDPQGWHGVDLTAQPGTLFHVDDYRVIGGTKSLWCGTDATTDEHFCHYASLPGYGNGWDQYFESRTFQVTGDVTVSLDYEYDTEPGYDFTYVEYSTDGGTTWNNMQTFTGIGSGFLDHYTITGADSIRVRFHFVSDGSWSDEDGQYDSQGAIIIDDIEIADGAGVVDMQDFESENLGDILTSDGDWAAFPAPGYGDFSGLFPGLSVLQEDECTKFTTYLWGFFNGSPYDYGCAGHPEQKVVPYKNERNQYINNEIWSPWIEWNPGGAIPSSASGAVFEFWVYQKGLVLNSLVFYSWNIRFKQSGNPCPTPWIADRFLYYGPVVPVVHAEKGVGDLVPPGATHVQLALSVIDMCPYWCGYYGDGSCHSHAPLFDHVKFYRLDYVGPLWTVDDEDLFQDGFPADGTVTGTVRCDMARDLAASSSPDFRPGDSLVVRVDDPVAGLGTDPYYGGAAVYMHVRSSGGEQGTDVSGDLSRWPVVSTGNGWTTIRMDTVYNDPARTQHVLDKYCVDLNDNLFAPPDRIDFYLSATNAGGITTYWSRDVGATSSEQLVIDHPMEMQCLPTGNSDVLYVDDFDGRGAQPYFDSAFDLLGITPDRYDVRSPSSTVGNGLGARAAVSQVADVYRAIIWNSGNLVAGTICDGPGNNIGKSPDAQLLYDFLDQTTLWNPGLYMSGDNVAYELSGSSPSYVLLRSYIDYSATLDHVAAGLPVSPLVTGDMPGTIFQHAGMPAFPDTMIAYGGCPSINGFDVLSPNGAATMQMHYEPIPGAGAVISQETVNPQNQTARVVLSGFSYHYIRDDRVLFPADMADHLAHILSWFETSVSSPTGATDVPGGTSLRQNYPNPFNPTTTIEFTIKRRTRAALKIYNTEGRLVAVLLDEAKDPDTYKVVWDGKDRNGMPVASGVYFYRLIAGKFDKTRKMVLLK
jgi:hypothetical protein